MTSYHRFRFTGPAREKDISRQKELEHQKKGLRFLTNPASEMYKACVERIATLEALMQR